MWAEQGGSPSGWGLLQAGPRLPCSLSHEARLSQWHDPAAHGEEGVLGASWGSPSFTWTWSRRC